MEFECLGSGVTARRSGDSDSEGDRRGGARGKGQGRRANVERSILLLSNCGESWT